MILLNFNSIDDRIKFRHHLSPFSCVCVSVNVLFFFVRLQFLFKNVPINVDCSVNIALSNVQHVEENIHNNILKHGQNVIRIELVPFLSIPIEPSISFIYVSIHL